MFSLLFSLLPLKRVKDKDFFLEANDDLLSQLEDLVMPLESIATQVFQAIYQRQQAEISWIALL